MTLTRQQWLRLAPLIVMLVFVLLLSSGLFTKNSRKDYSAPKAVPLIGYEIPQFNLPFVGRPTTKHSFSPRIFRGNVVMINIFGSWCQPCAAEHPVLMNLARTGRVNMVGIAWKDKEPKIIQYLTDNGNPFQLVGLDEMGDTTIPLGLTGVPETIIIDQKGFVVFDTKEPLTEEVVDKTILPLIAKLDPDSIARAERIKSAAAAAAAAAEANAPMPQVQPPSVPAAPASAPTPVPAPAPAPAQAMPPAAAPR